MNKYYNFINKKEDEYAELYIEGEIVEQGWEREFLESFFGENAATSSNEFSKQLKELNGKPIKIYCNSCGGSLFAGTAMYAALVNYKGKKTGYIGSICASAATFPMLACDKTYMSAASGYCCHLPMVWFEVFGNRQDIEEAVEETINGLKQIENVMIDAYQRKTGLGTEKIRTLLEKDEVMNAKQTIELGFVDGYTEDEPKFDSEFVKNMFNRNVMVYNSLKPKYEEQPKETMPLEAVEEPVTNEKVEIKQILTEEETIAQENKLYMKNGIFDIIYNKEKAKTKNINTYKALLLKRK